MIYECKKCNYTTKIKRDFEKHKITNKHVQNTQNVHICEICNATYKAKTTFYLHRKKCTHDTQYGQKPDKNSDLIIELINTQHELEKEKLKNEYEQKQNEILINLIKNTTKTTEKALKITDKTISAIKYANEHFKNAPVLTPINNFNMLEYDLTNEEDKKILIETLLYHYRKNSVHKVFGDHIVSIYKKDNLADQSMHTTDTSRMNYIIKISKDDNNNAKWYTDKNGVVICDVIIEKLINHYVNLLKWYQKKLLDELSLNPGIVQPDKQQKVENILGMLMDVDNGTLIKNTNRYIAPFFNLDK